MNENKFKNAVVVSMAQAKAELAAAWAKLGFKRSEKFARALGGEK